MELLLSSFFFRRTQGRFWTADQLARRGLPHPPNFPHCDQAAKSINHLLLSCVFGSLLRNVGLQHLCPQQNEYFDGRWDRISKEVVDVLRKGLNSLVILGTWTLWNDHNKCISDGASLSVARALSCGGDNTPTDHGMGRPQAHHRHGHHAQAGLVSVS